MGSCGEGGNGEGEVEGGGRVGGGGVGGGGACVKHDLRHGRGRVPPQLANDDSDVLNREAPQGNRIRTPARCGRGKVRGGVCAPSFREAGACTASRRVSAAARGSRPRRRPPSLRSAAL